MPFRVCVAIQWALSLVSLCPLIAPTQQHPQSGKENTAEEKQSSETKLQAELGTHGELLMRDRSLPGNPIVGIDYSGVMGDFAMTLQRLPHTVKLLCFDGTDINNEDMSVLDGLAIENLDLSFTQVTNDGLVHIANCASLRRLSLSGGAVQDAGLEQLEALKNLEILHIDDCNIGDDGLKHLMQLKSLKSLDLSGTGITDAGLAHLAHLEDLLVLDLSDTVIGDTGLAHMCLMPKLRYVDISHTLVTDRGLGVLADLPSLKIIAVEGTRISDEGLKMLRSARPGLVVIEQKRRNRNGDAASIDGSLPVLLPSRPR